MKMLFDGHDVLCAATAYEALEFIGQEGYFAETRYGLEFNVKYNLKSRLESVGDDRTVFCFGYELHGCSQASSLFLPACKVKPAEDSNA